MLYNKQLNLNLFNSVTTHTFFFWRGVWGGVDDVVVVVAVAVVRSEISYFQKYACSPPVCSAQIQTAEYPAESCGL